ncbi:MAG TPA: Tex-like N-terminal domain-containing protein, partial [Symbiobacteriaceae bacterium]|nr:Tex-like N-terminal domain-containing protein [Symbiobacteriaceae bacterium]
MSQERILAQLARELQLKPVQVQNCVAMIDEGNTIPFISRYRKEATGEMDENQIRDL